MVVKQMVTSNKPNLVICMLVVQGLLEAVRTSAVQAPMVVVVVVCMTVVQVVAMGKIEKVQKMVQVVPCRIVEQMMTMKRKA